MTTEIKADDDDNCGSVGIWRGGGGEWGCASSEVQPVAARTVVSGRSWTGWFMWPVICLSVYLFICHNQPQARPTKS